MFDFYSNTTHFFFFYGSVVQLKFGDCDTFNSSYLIWPQGIKGQNKTKTGKTESLKNHGNWLTTEWKWAKTEIQKEIEAFLELSKNEYPIMGHNEDDLKRQVQTLKAYRKM